MLMMQRKQRGRRSCLRTKRRLRRCSDALDDAVEPAPTETGSAGEPYSTVSRFDDGAAFFGSVSESTPLSNLAVALASSTSLASVKLRATEP